MTTQRQTGTSARTAGRVRAPRLVGRGGWLNVGDATPELRDLRGKVVLLDFWTFCCLNCLHVIDELRPLEERYADVLVVVGVHSPKFAHESDHAAVRAAVDRYEVRHPVLDDPDLTTWDAYAVRAWPTLVVVDPEGYVVAHLSGEGHADDLAGIVDALVREHEARGTLRRGGAAYQPDPEDPSELRFPGKAVALPGGTLLVSDSRHHALVELSASRRQVRRLGSGFRGRGDGVAASFAEPQGLLLLPSDIASEVGYDVLVADTANHLLRGLRLADGVVTTVAGSGAPWAPGSGVRDLSSPWDLAWWRDTVVVAMAGIHQLWSFDPRTRTLAVLAGTAHEGLRDGALDDAWFAQPSGLAVDADGTLWVADAETSALRAVTTDAVTTVVGTGLFDFGHRDGPAAQALLQHPLGVTALPDGSVAVLDTYNGAVRRYDPATGRVSTLATGLAEPSDALVVDCALVVVESGGHRLVEVALTAGTEVSGAEQRTARPAVEVAPGEVVLEVLFDAPAGQQVDHRDGPGIRVSVSASPPALLRSGEGVGRELRRTLVLDPAVGDGVLHVAASVAACDSDPAVEHPVCRLHRQDWGVPVVLVPGAQPRLALALHASAAG